MKMLQKMVEQTNKARPEKIEDLKKVIGSSDKKTQLDFTDLYNESSSDDIQILLNEFPEFLARMDKAYELKLRQNLQMYTFMDAFPGRNKLKELSGHRTFELLVHYHQYVLD